MNLFLGPFADIMDVRVMVDEDLVPLIDEYDPNTLDLSALKYAGNPLSDAQIALFLKVTISVFTQTFS